MSTLNVFNTIKEAVSNLNPKDIRGQVERPVRVGLFAATETGYRQMEAFFLPSLVSYDRQVELTDVIERGKADVFYDIRIFSPELLAGKDAFTFDLHHPDRTVRAILKAHPDLSVPLARHIYPFREPVVRGVIKNVAKENAWFSLATALPDIIPFISLPWAIGEFASDTAVLTANQIRMAFLLAAASNHDIGYREQKGEMVSLMLSAFGWRAIARELVGHIPFGGGLIPKAAIAYAGTRVVGMSLERYYRIGYGFSRQERRVAFQEALESGKTVASGMLDKIGATKVSLR